jgi:hypothetical protein
MDTQSGIRFTAMAALVLSFALDAAHSARAAGTPLPQRLSETGLFVTGSVTTVRPDVISFSPQYPLWADSATKRRWIALPPGTAIDARRPDAWEFPHGTRFWKEFALDRRVETRYIERLADGSWRFATYVWNEAGTDADLAPPEGIPALPVASAPGGQYVIPSEPDCRACHEGGAVPVLGFSALQLSPDRDPLAPHVDKAPTSTSNAYLPGLVAAGLLRNLPRALLDQPPRIVAASPIERAALGYLHANCGHCHSPPNETGASVPAEIVLAQTVAGGFDGGAMRRALLSASSRFRQDGLPQPARVIEPGHAAASVLTLRMRTRNPRVQMPPLGTAVPDSAALSILEQWIDHELLRDAVPENSTSNATKEPSS